MADIPGPLYQQVADDIRTRIVSGEYPVGTPIPSTLKLGERHGVSQTVVRKAVEQLRDEGVLVGQPGKAVYVKALPEQAAAGRRDLAALADEVAGVRDWLTRVETNLMELYGKTGYDYPGESPGERDRRIGHG